MNNKQVAILETRVVAYFKSLSR